MTNNDNEEKPSNAARPRNFVLPKLTDNKEKIRKLDEQIKNRPVLVRPKNKM